MSKMQVVEGSGVVQRLEEVVEFEREGYVKEFTRHSNDVLLNLNELRRRGILTDATLFVGSARLQAHCAVLIACSGFFYSLFSRRGPGACGVERGVTLSLPEELDAGSVSLLLDFMYTSRLPLTPHTVTGVLAAATYLQMEHVADTCRAFMQQSERTCVPSPLMELASRHSPTPPVGNFHNSLMSGSSPPAQLCDSTRPPAEAEDQSRSRARIPGEGWAPSEPGECLKPVSRPRSLKAEELSPPGPSTPSPGSPSQSSCQPNSPAESNTCSLTSSLMMNHTEVKPMPDPKACNWKKYKYIVLNPLCATPIKEEEPGERQQECGSSLSSTDRTVIAPKPSPETYSMENPRQDQGLVCPKISFGPQCEPVPHSTDTIMEPLTSPDRENGAPYMLYQRPNNPVKFENQCSYICYPGNQSNAKTVCNGDKPYRCNVCGAQFNRPANLKTHSRIHSGEKPYRCDTCGARFVQVAHLRAHVLIHTGEKPYPCHTCGTRFRHLQTLKSHLRIHTGEKPYSCEKCDLHFRHKSQLRLHLRQKHGAVTNTKIRYKVLTDPYQPGPPVLQAC
ncbi:B-cell CLL/lymphoma 6 member B protein [Chanos chanos]|uniref:B-cell CLL/lymphoma 6 member B protein n=1 Tax=Chanos chanos TaxID=29144 RepID=A0A6J2VW63_CHACN|nr:B-cell CLL/lymphoma 6 member B protein-like [Chanos chanos]